MKNNIIIILKQNVDYIILSSVSNDLWEENIK